MNWEIKRHHWTDIAPGLMEIPTLLLRLIDCLDAQEANQIYWMLDALLVPNQVLKPGSPEVTSCVIQFLPSLSPEARVWGLELLAQFSAGTIGPTAADPDIVARVASEISWAIPPVAQILQYGSDTEALLCVDILENCYEHATDRRDRIRFLFAEFSKRGPDADQRIRVSPVPVQL